MTVQLRRLADVNPATPAFDRLPGDEDVTFQPLETVWADDRADRTRVRIKADVAVGYVRFQSGDVLLPKTAPTFKHGRTMIAQNLTNGVGAGSSELHILRAKDGVDPRFVAYVVQSNVFLREGVSAYQGVAGLQRVPADFVAEWPVEPLKTQAQRAVGDFLDAQVGLLDGAINARRRQTLLLVEKRKAWLASLFGAPHAETRTIPLIHLLKQPPNYGVLVPRFDPRGTPFIRVNDLAALRVGRGPATSIENEQSFEYRRTIVAPGDVLTSVVGTLGQSSIVPENAAGSNIARAVCRLQPSPDVAAWFLLGWLNSPQFLSDAKRVTEGSAAQATLNMSDIMKFRVTRPTDDDYLVAGAKIEETFNIFSIADLTLQRAEYLLGERKRALITAAVTGQLDVTTARSGLGVDVP